jgi:hypothetical protein
MQEDDARLLVMDMFFQIGWYHAASKRIKKPRKAQGRNSMTVGVTASLYLRGFVMSSVIFIMLFLTPILINFTLSVKPLVHANSIALGLGVSLGAFVAYAAE